MYLKVSVKYSEVKISTYHFALQAEQSNCLSFSYSVAAYFILNISLEVPGTVSSTSYCYRCDLMVMLILCRNKMNVKTFKCCSLNEYIHFHGILSLYIFKFYEQYDDDEIGALDNAELEGSIQVDSNRLEEVLNDYYKEKAEKYGDFSLFICFFSFSNKVCNCISESNHPVRIHIKKRVHFP